MMLQSAPLFRERYPINVMVDVFNGSYVPWGDQVVMFGGIPNYTLIGGPANSYKTAIALSYLKAMLKNMPPELGGPDAVKSAVWVHDSELTLEWVRLINSLSDNKINISKEEGEEDKDVAERGYDEVMSHPLYTSGRLAFTDKSSASADDWGKHMQELSDERAAYKKSNKYLIPTKLPSPNGQHYMLAPTGVLLDSLSDLSFDAMDDILQKNKVDDAGNQTLDMRSSGIKYRLMGRMQTCAATGSMAFIATAHMAKEIKLSPYDPSSQTLKEAGSLIFKNCPQRTAFQTSLTLVINKVMDAEKGDKKPLFPTPGGSIVVNDKSYHICNMVFARNKSGKTGYVVPLVTKQGEGVDWGLSMFYYLLTYNNQYGMTKPEGVTRESRLELCPDVLLERKNIVTLVKDPKVYRALEITTEMYNYKLIDPNGEKTPYPLAKNPAKLKEAIEAKGIDWNWILENTTYCWSLDNYKGKHVLSYPDLLKMMATDWLPEWYPKD